MEVFKVGNVDEFDLHLLLLDDLRLRNFPVLVGSGVEPGVVHEGSGASA